MCEVTLSAREVFGHIQSVESPVILNPADRLHVDILFRFGFHSFDVAHSFHRFLEDDRYSPEVSNFNRLVISQTQHRFSPDIIYNKLCSITLVATKVHMIFWSFLVLTWICDTIELV
jgi:hypothetical protein